MTRRPDACSDLHRNGSPFCFAEAAANLLINPALDPFGKIPELKFCAARIAPVKVAAE